MKLPAACCRELFKYFQMRHIFLLLPLSVLLISACQNSTAWLSQDLGEPLLRIENVKPLSAVNPTGNEFPGGRGSHHLVVYTPDYGDKTGTNEWGSEAVVENGLVVSIGGNNSTIPENGLVVSGNESSSIWINKNLEVGMEVMLTPDNQLKYTRTENTDIERARAVYRKAQTRMTEKTGLNLYAEQFKAAENEINQHFKLFLNAKSEKNNEAAKDEAKQLLHLAQGLYYQTFAPKKGEFKGVWVRLIDNTPQELTNTIQRMADAGINAILPETIYDGYTIYPNGHELLPQLPQFEGWDPMALMIEECAKHNMEVIPWTEMFFVGGANSPLAKQKPEWMGMFRHGTHAAELEPGFHYFCPSRPEVHQFLLQTLDTLASRYPVNGVQLDYIRYSLSEPWEKGLCYCDYCQSKLKKELGFDILKITPEDKAEWTAWNEFRTENITRFVKAASALFTDKYPNVPLSADVVPDSHMSLRQKFQDWKSWVDNDYINEIYIMSYSPRNEDIKADAELLMQNVKSSNTRPIVGLGPYLGFQPDLLLQQIEIAREAGADGVCLFSFNALSPGQLDALKRGPFRKE